MAKSADTPQLRPGDPGYVGRGYPPEHGKIRKGEVRNPFGCKGKTGKGGKPQATDHHAAMAEELARRVPAKNGTSYTRDQLLVHVVTRETGEGNMRAAEMLWRMLQHYQLTPQAVDEDHLGADDLSIIERHNRKVLLRAGVDPDAIADSGQADPDESVGTDEADYV